MAENIKIKTKISGVFASNESDSLYIYEQRDGQIKINFLYMGGGKGTTETPYDLPMEKTDYATLIESARGTNSFLINYVEDNTYGTDQAMGLAPYLANATGNAYSIYRREYNIYTKQIYNSYTNSFDTTVKKYIGQWEPVAGNITVANLRDFNIEAGKTYQYIIYPSISDHPEQQFANAPATAEDSTHTGTPVITNWSEWSIAELIPESTDPYIPILKKSYKVDLNNIWMFKYALETGSQTQNINRSETQTLGQFIKIGYGNSNYISGEVSAFLGSEIVPMTTDGYIERLRKSIKEPLSTNEKALMLSKWRSFVKSKNPKLLKDMKGQSWIVQIMSNSNTPRNFYHNQPDTISFSWKQIASTDDVIIYGSGEKLPELGACDSTWSPTFSNKNN